MSYSPRTAKIPFAAAALPRGSTPPLRPSDFSSVVANDSLLHKEPTPNRFPLEAQIKRSCSSCFAFSIFALFTRRYHSV